MNELAVSIGVILFPGLIASIICDKIALHSRWQVFKYSTYSFVFGVLCYASLQLLVWLRQLVGTLCGAPLGELARLHVWSFAVTQKADILFSEVIWATALAPVIAALATIINQRKYLTRFARWIGVSYKYGDENLFSYYLNRTDIDKVYIRDLTTLQTYIGVVEQYSETDHIQEVVLSDVYVYKYETSDFLYKLPSIYLARTTGTFVIEAFPAVSLPEEQDGKKAATE